MSQSLYSFFVEDHKRINRIFNKAIADIHHIDIPLYTQYRYALLTHIGMEERILYKMAQLADENAIPMAKQLRIEHAAIACLMVPTPNASLIKVIQHVLTIHNEKEENDNGIYALCNKLTEEQTQEAFQQIKSFPPAAVKVHRDTQIVWDFIRKSCLQAGWDYDSIANS